VFHNFSNKQDIPTATSPDDCHKLYNELVIDGWTWSVFSSNAISKEKHARDLLDACAWLVYDMMAE